MVALPTPSPELVTAEAPQSRVGGDAFQRTPQAGIGGGLEALGQGADELATSLAKAAGTEAGKQAVTLDANGQPQVATSLTSPILLGRAGPAYENAVRAAIEPTMRAGLTQTMVGMRQEQDLDPNATPQDWLKKVGEFAKEVRGRYPGTLGETAFNTVVQQGTQHYANIVDQETKTDISQSKQTIDSDLNTAQNRLFSLARQGVSGTPEFAQAREQFDAAYKKLDDNADLFGLSSDAIAATKKKAELDLVGHGATGAIDRAFADPGPNGGVAGAQKIVKEQITNNPALNDLSLGERTRLETIANARIEYNKQEATARIGGSAAASKALVDAYAKGTRVDDQTFQTVRDNAKWSGDFDGVAQLEAARKAYETRAPLASLGVRAGVGSLGVVNQVYRGDPNQAGPNGGPSAAGLYSYYISKGASRNEAVLLTGAAASESGLNPAAVHDEGTGYGMFGHRLERRDAMFSDAGTRAPNWQQQADFALKELRARPEGAAVNNAKTPEELATAQMHFERPQGYTSDTPTAGLNYTGRLNTIRRFSSLDGSAPIPEVTPPGSVAMPFTPDQMRQNPYLVVAAYRQYDTDKGYQVQTAQQLATAAGNMMRAGVTPSVEQMAQVVQAGQAFPRELGNTATELMRQYAGHTGGAADAQLPAGTGEARQAAVAQYVRANPNIAGVQYMQAYNTQFNAERKRQVEEPQQYAAEKGWRAPPQALTPGDPQAFAAQISDRVAGSHFIANRLGQAPEAVTFGAQDKADIASFLQSAPGPQARAAMQTLIGGLSTAAADQLFRDKDTSRAVIAMSKSDDPDKINAGFQAMDAQYRRDPAQFDAQFKGESARLSDWQSRLSYYTPDQIAKQNMKATDPAQDTARKAAEKIADDATKLWTADYVAKQFGSGITSYIPGLRSLVGSIPSAPPDFESAKGAMLADAQMLYRDHFVQNGDPAQSLKDTMEKLANKYSVSEINGNRVMPYAPEKRFQEINGSHDWIKGQLGEFVQKNVVPSEGSMGMPLPTPMGFDIPAGLPGEAATTYFPRTTAEQTAYAKVYAPRMLFSDADTQADIAAGRPPSYAVIAADPNGRTVPLTDTKLQPLRFTPDYNRALGEWNAVQAGRHPAAQRGNAAAIEAAADPMRGGG